MDVAAMRLDRLLDAVDVLETRGDPTTVEVRAITQDSREIVPGTLYCAVPGLRVDGHDFAASAAAAGAVAVLGERLLPLDGHVVQARVGVGAVRPAMAQLAATFHGDPSRDLIVVGVTGTNGKTTVTHLLAAVLEAHGWSTAVVGTLGGTHTTPDAPVLQALLARERDEGREAVAMEVSSHALDQHRVDAVDFTVTVFTNLSRDHLDYHGTMDRYFAAKASLLAPGRTGLGVVNADDSWGQRLLERAGVPLVPYSMAHAEELRIAPTGSSFVWEGERVSLRIGGRFNVANAIAAATTARLLDVEAATVAVALSKVESVPGRFERVEAGQPFTLLVDYAHTPDALEHALRAAREGTEPGRRVILVFGAGGDRDRGKRPRMGEVAARLSDLAVLSSDNPRTEDPLAIIEEVRAGASDPDAFVVEADRARAIQLALGEAGPGDVVLIAGKGHERTQVIADQAVPFDDRDVARQAVAHLLRARGGP